MLDALSDYWWVAPLAGAAFLAYRFLGWRGLLAVLSLGAIGGVYTKGKRDERATLKREQAERDARAWENRRNVEDEIANLDPVSKRERLGKWMRDDD